MLMFALHNEPLLDERIFDWVRHIKSVNPKCYCILPTNGELLDRFSLAEIRQSGLNQLNVSLNAHSRETYQQINNGLDYDRVMKNIYHLMSDQCVKQKLQLMFVLNEKNAHEIHKAVTYWKQQGVRSKVVQITNRAGSLDTYERLRPKNARYTRPLLLRVWKNIMSNTRDAIGCELPFYQMNILFNGDVIICSYDWKRATVIGNVRTNSLTSIWNSGRMREIRRLILRRKYEEISTCSGCSVIG